MKFMCFQNATHVAEAYCWGRNGSEVRTYRRDDHSLLSYSHYRSWLEALTVLFHIAIRYGMVKVQFDAKGNPLETGD